MLLFITHCCSSRRSGKLGLSPIPMLCLGASKQCQVILYFPVHGLDAQQALCKLFVLHLVDTVVGAVHHFGKGQGFNIGNLARWEVWKQSTCTCYAGLCFLCVGRVGVWGTGWGALLGSYVGNCKMVATPGTLTLFFAARIS